MQFTVNGADKKSKVDAGLEPVTCSGRHVDPDVLTGSLKVSYH